MKLPILLFMFPTIGAFILPKQTFSSKLQKRKFESSPHEELIDNLFNQGFYTINASIGTPKQNFVLRLDMLSSNVWVGECFEKECSSDSGHTRFDSKKSSTFSSSGAPIELFYPYGPLKGEIANDVLSFGGMNLRNQEFALIEKIPAAYELKPFDGYLGLSFGSSGNLASPLQKAKSQLDQPIFTTWLGDQNSDEGEISFGSHLPSQCQSDSHFVPLTSESLWKFPISDCSIGSFRSSQRFSAVSDISTFGIGVPNGVLKTIVHQTNAKYDGATEMFVVPCEEIASLPDLKLNIGGKKYAILARNYVIQLIGFKPKMCVLSFFSTEKKRGFDWILGNVFSRSFCISYDFGNGRIGFAQHRN